MEPVVAGLAARRITTQALAELRCALDEPEELVAMLEALPRFMELGFRFHADLAHGCGNRMLADLLAQLVNTETHPLLNHR
jgi:GntR family uxuAB operon transcriptional repressor